MTYNIFISHSWNYSDQYDRLIKLLREKPYFTFKDYSVPFSDPINTNGTTKQLRDAIIKQMTPTSCVLVLAGVYSTYSKWINEEIGIAKNSFVNNPKKIIAIEPWGAERTSTVVKDAADIIVKWNTDSIVDAIRN